MNNFKFMTLSEWRKREFQGQGWDNRTIKKMISNGIFKGILYGNKSLIREDQTLTQLDDFADDLEALIQASI